MSPARAEIAPLHWAALLCHAALLGAAGTLGFGLAESAPWRAVGAAAATAPLLAALPGLLAANPRSAAWLSVALVAYCGAASVEVVATAGAARAATVALLAAAVELGLLLALIRRWPRAARG